MTVGKRPWRPGEAAGGSHSSTSRLVPHDEALEREMAFRREHPDPEVPHRVVDYFTAPPGFPQFPIPPAYLEKKKPRRYRRFGRR
jgi:hypothetical protein